MRTFFSYLFLTLFATQSYAQVSIAPPALFISSSSHFGTFLVENKTGDPQEVSIKFRFGYPISDSLGNLSMQYDDSVAEALHSMADWVKGFPRKFILPPGTQQIVRLNTQPPANLSDGIYWSRIITSAQAQAKRIDTIRSGITTQINVAFEQVTTVLYCKGSLTTNLEIIDPIVIEDSATIRLVWKTVKTGNAPYFGTLKVKLVDASGTDIDESTEIVGIYATMNKKASFSHSKVKAGNYTAEVTFISERNDIASENIIHIPPIVKKIAFTIK